MDLKQYTTTNIFKRTDVLRDEYIPDKIKRREKYIDALAQRVYAPPLGRQPPNHLFIYGFTGTGKTLTNLFCMEKLEEQAPNQNVKVKTIYVNCARFKTDTAVLTELYRQATGQPTYHNMQLSQIFEQFCKYIDENYEYVILVLDEVDRIIIQDDRLAYLLVRARENRDLKKAWLGLVMICNDVKTRTKLHPGTQSSFGMSGDLTYERYNDQEFFDILKERATEAFYHGVITDDIIKLIANHIFMIGSDIRQALSFLYEMGVIAQTQQDPTLTIDHFEKAKSIVEEREIERQLLTFSNQEKILFFALCYTHQTETNKDIETIYNNYEKFCTKLQTNPLTKRSIYNYLNSFTNKGFVESKTIKGLNYYAPSFDPTLISKTLTEYFNQRQQKLATTF